MHFYIYQIFRNPQPEKDWITDLAFMENPGLMPNADYICKIQDRSTALHALADRLERHHIGTLSGNSFILVPCAPEIYFKERFKVFQKALDALHEVTETQYIHNYSYVNSLFSNLRHSFSDTHDDHMMSAENLPVPFDQFVRMSESGIPFYIGGIVDCHC